MQASAPMVFPRASCGHTNEHWKMVTASSCSHFFVLQTRAGVGPVSRAQVNRKESGKTKEVGGRDRLWWEAKWVALLLKRAARGTRVVEDGWDGTQKTGSFAKE